MANWLTYRRLVQGENVDAMEEARKIAKVPNVKSTSRFKKDYKAIKKRGYKRNLLQEVIEALASGKKVPEKNEDHDNGNSEIFLTVLF